MKVVCANHVVTKWGRLKLLLSPVIIWIIKALVLVLLAREDIKHALHSVQEAAWGLIEATVVTLGQVLVWSAVAAAHEVIDWVLELLLQLSLILVLQEAFDVYTVIGEIVSKDKCLLELKVGVLLVETVNLLVFAGKNSLEWSYLLSELVVVLAYFFQLRPDALNVALLLQATFQRTLPVLKETLLPLAKVSALYLILNLIKFFGDTAFWVVALLTHIWHGVVKKLNPVFCWFLWSARLIVRLWAAQTITCQQFGDVIALLLSWLQPHCHPILVGQEL